MQPLAAQGCTGEGRRSSVGQEGALKIWHPWAEQRRTEKRKVALCWTKEAGQGRRPCAAQGGGGVGTQIWAGQGGQEKTGSYQVDNVEQGKAGSH